MKARKQSTLAERRAAGRKLRDTLKRTELGEWAPPPDRPDPVALIQESNAERLPDLVPLKMERMLSSPFGFFRGAAQVMARDLARQGVTGLHVQMCGDAHVRNLGAYGAPDGHLVFDINDFDETMPGPWEWDLKRLAVSLILAGREAGDADDLCGEAVRAFVESYRVSMERFSRMGILELARLEIAREIRKDPVGEVLARAERATPLHTLEKLTLSPKSGWPRFHDQPPLLSHVPGEKASKVIESLGPYRDTLGPDRQLVLDAYRPVDVAFKVVGTGSVGTRDYVVLLFGESVEDPMILQVKEELPSCYARYLPEVPPFAHQGRRVAEGQHRMQTCTDPLLGWTAIEGRDFLVRQLSDHKASIEPAELQGEALASYGEVCGEIFAKAHARTGDSAMISGYCGRSGRLDRALERFAKAYADQSTQDHAVLRKAVRAGVVKASVKRRPRVS